MKAFTFRLESLLHLRQSAREKALVSYASSIRDREEVEGKLMKLKSSELKINQEISSSRSCHLNQAKEQSFQNALITVKNSILDFHKKLEDAKRVEIAKKSIFLKADSSHKSILRLKDKQNESHVRNQLKKEERELDDIINSRYQFQSNFQY